jgi:hypothetical protein
MFCELTSNFNDDPAETSDLDSLLLNGYNRPLYVIKNIIKYEFIIPNWLNPINEGEYIQGSTSITLFIKQMVHNVIMHTQNTIDT